MSHFARGTTSRRAFLQAKFLRAGTQRGREGQEGNAEVRVALIHPASCLTYEHQVCTSCLERCPTDGALKLDGLHPRVIPDACTGCGDCQRACPAPGGAILLLPNRSRRQRTGVPA